MNMNNEFYIREHMKATTESLISKHCRARMTQQSEVETTSENTVLTDAEIRNITKGNIRHDWKCAGQILESRCFKFEGTTLYLSPTLTQIYRLKNGRGKHYAPMYEDSPSCLEVVDSLDLFVRAQTKKLQAVLDGYAAANDLSQYIARYYMGENTEAMEGVFESIFGSAYSEIDAVHPLSIATLGNFISECEDGLSSNLICLIAGVVRYVSAPNAKCKVKLSLIRYIAPLLSTVVMLSSFTDEGGSTDVKIKVSDTVRAQLLTLTNDNHNFGVSAKKAIKAVSCETDYNLTTAYRTIDVMVHYLNTITSRVILGVNFTEAII